MPSDALEDPIEACVSESELAAPAQERFDRAYVTCRDLQRELGVSRAAILYARQRGDIPPPIVINGGQFTIWERDTIKPFADTWLAKLQKRRKEVV